MDCASITFTYHIESHVAPRKTSTQWQSTTVISKVKSDKGLNVSWRQLLAPRGRGHWRGLSDSERVALVSLRGFQKNNFNLVKTLEHLHHIRHESFHYQKDLELMLQDQRVCSDLQDCKGDIR